MKIAYISSNNLAKKAVDTNQTLNTIISLSKYSDITFISSWISKRAFKQCLEFFLIEKSFNYKRIPIRVNTRYFLIEKITRLIYCFYVTIFLKFNKYDFIYTRDFSYIYFLTFLPKFLKPKQKIVFEAHKIYHKTSKKVNLKQEKKALFQADYFVTNSEGTKKGLVFFLNIVSEKVIVLRNGVNLNNFYKRDIDKNYLVEKYNVAVNDKIIVYTGSFQKWKGVEYLIEASDYIKIDNYKILLIGGYGKDKKRIEYIVNNHKQRDRFIVEGYLSQEDILKILSLSDIAVIPNNRTIEGANYTSPVKTFEYMAMGLPIVASYLPAINEILTGKENCLFFEPENVNDLAEKINILLLDDGLKKEFTKNNLKKAKEYTWDKRAKKIINLLCKKIY